MHRKSLFRDAGYALQGVSGPEALDELARTKVDLVVLGHTLPRDERLRLEAAIQQLRSRPRVIMLYESSIDGAERADAVLNASSGPEDLIRTIQYLLTGVC